jgi:DNA-directed RNA polymerase specialized sigma24 family protein
MLRYVAGLSPEEIARVIKSNRGAVYAAIARAEKKLRVFLDPVVRP